MAGEALTGKFMLGTATVMVGLPADMENFQPSTHSIGLVKNFSITSDPAYTELTHGKKNSIVASVMTSNPVRATMEVFEYTSRNLAYALGLDGSVLSAPGAAVTSTVTDVVTDGSPTPTSTVSLVSVTGFAINDWIMIQQGTEDRVIVRKVTAVTVGTNDLTVTPVVSQDISAGATVTKVNKVDVGSKDEQPFLAAVIVGTLADESEVVIQIPKLRIVKGFHLAFQTDNFGNLPIEFTVYDQVSTDTHYADFAGASARIFAAA